MTVFSSARRKTALPLAQSMQQSGDDVLFSEHIYGATDVFSTWAVATAVASQQPDRIGVSHARYVASAPSSDATMTEVSLQGFGCLRALHVCFTHV